jgi:SOS-response transcriptional repressor LexA
MDWIRIIDTIEKEKPQTSIAKMLDVRPQYISDLKSGKSKNPGADFVLKLINVYGINPSWLLNGDGPMTVDGAEKGYQAELPDAVQLRGRHTIPMALSEGNPDVVMVPFYNSRVSAGPGRDIAVHQEFRPIPVITSFLSPYNPATVRALKVKGDSMTKIGLFDEDVVFFVPIDDPGDGVYVLSINEKLLVKRVEFDPFGSEIRIISENERYQPRVLKGDDMAAVKIEGKVIGWLHKHPY